MVIDTSAVVAVIFGEADRPAFVEAIERASVRLISAATRVELSFVVEGRAGEPGRRLLERFLAGTAIDIVSFTPQHASLAIQAFRTYGKGRHPAGLNIGDCFSHALAQATGYPLLFKGDDFSRTDVRAAGVIQ